MIRRTKNRLYAKCCRVFFFLYGETSEQQYKNVRVFTIKHTSKLIATQSTRRENQTNRMLLTCCCFFLYFFFKTLLFYNAISHIVYLCRVTVLLFHSLFRRRALLSAHTAQHKTKSNVMPLCFRLCRLLLANESTTQNHRIVIALSVCVNVLSCVGTSVCSSDVEPVGRPIILHFRAVAFFVSGSISRVTMKLNIGTNSARPKLLPQIIKRFFSRYYNVRYSVCVHNQQQEWQ